MSRRALARLLCLCALIGASLAVAATPAAAGNPTPKFDITVGNCWRGQVPDQYAKVHVRWQDADGNLIDRFTVVSQEYGYWNFPNTDTTCETRPVRAGDQLSETELDHGMYSRSYIVKALSGTFDRRTNLVNGHAPQSSVFYVGVIQDDLIGYSGGEVCPDVTVARDANGSFTYDTTNCHGPYNAAGGDQAWLTWQSSSGDREVLVLTAPYAQVGFGTTQVGGHAFASTSVSTTLKSSTGTVRATGNTTSGTLGAWLLNDKNTSGQGVRPHIGDVVSGNWATGTSTFKVFGMTTGFGPTPNTVHGICTPNTHYSLIVLWTGSTYGSRTNGMTDGTGSTGDYTPDSHTLASGDHVLFTCAKPNGDRERQVTVYP